MKGDAIMPNKIYRKTIDDLVNYLINNTKDYNLSFGFSKPNVPVFYQVINDEDDNTYEGFLKRNWNFYPKCHSDFFVDDNKIKIHLHYSPLLPIIKRKENEAMKEDVGFLKDIKNSILSALNLHSKIKYLDRITGYYQFEKQVITLDFDFEKYLNNFEKGYALMQSEIRKVIKSNIQDVFSGRYIDSKGLILSVKGEDLRYLDIIFEE